MWFSLNARHCPKYITCSNSFNPCQTPVAAAAKSLQSCPTLWDPIDGSPPWLPHPWDSPGKNTRVGCHFPLQCMKVKGESEVAQSCPTLRDPMDCSLPGSSIAFSGQNPRGYHFYLTIILLKIKLRHREVK